MDNIPNWFRWLIIVIATLIMCACRTPLQQQPIAPTTSVLVNSLSGEAEVGASPAAISSLQETHHVQADVISNQIAPQPQPQAGIAFEEDDACQAPIIRHHGQRLRVQSLPQAVGKLATGHIKAPIYFHVDDQLFAIQQTQAVGTPTEAIAPEAMSPFADDPGPPADFVPPRPIVDPSFQIPTAPPAPLPATTTLPGEALPTHSYATPQPMPELFLGPHVSAGPIVDYTEVIPLPTTIVESSTPLPAPFDYLPQAEIPCEVAPEKWAMPPCETMEVSYGELSTRYPDEYVCDGGDALGEVNVLPDWTINNLDPEDTIGHYDTLDRKVEVAASNRVCIYAPRFAAVRKVTSPFQNDKYDQALIEQREDAVVTEQQEVTSVSYEKTVSVQRDVRIQPAAGLQRNVPSITGIHSLPVRVINKDFSAHEDFRVMKLGIHKQADKPRLAEFTMKAVTWASDKSVQVVVDGVTAQINSSVKSLESLHTIGDNRPAKLRVIKTASVSDALPGEEVEFTLRFDNVGHQPMGNVTIVDNLTTRLEYLDDTELCSLENNFVVDENDVESLTLKWEIKDPIQPGKGGLIRFKCRVR